MVETVHQYPGIRTTELMKLLGLPNETFYSIFRKAAYEDHRIEWKSCRLYPISPVELPHILREVHGLILKFPTYFNRTVVEALCAYLNESDLFTSQYINAKPTSKTAKEEKCRCITISCSNRPMPTLSNDLYHVVQILENQFSFFRNSVPLFSHATFV